MQTVQITIVADTEEQLNNRLAEIADQIKKGYSGATGKTKTESFKYIVKEASAGTTALLPRLPAVDGAAPEAEAEEQDEDDQDQAGTTPVFPNPVVGYAPVTGGTNNSATGSPVSLRVAPIAEASTAVAA